MAHAIKNQQAIISKLGIEKLNAMQEEACLAISASKDVVLLSPTGTGKTVAFLLPIIAELTATIEEIQALIIVPSRELAIQIESVIREMGTGFKTNAVYGGRSGAKDKFEIKHRPAILIGTPGRVSDHLRRGNFSAEHIKTLVLDEFDKSLEVGFEDEMKDIINMLPALNKKVLTSATQGVKIPAFVGVSDPLIIDYLAGHETSLAIKAIVSPSKDKLETLGQAIKQQGNVPGIVFCNFKDSIQRISDYLTDQGISHSCFYGGMEQKDRERALIKFRNGTNQVLLATDLAARGIDVPEIKYIIHYHLPHHEEEFIHRNGRTARMNKDGTAFVLTSEFEQLPNFISYSEEETLKSSSSLSASLWTTLFVSGGRKDKISKGDIAGLFLKIGGLGTSEIGVIELKQDCAFVAVHKSMVESLLSKVDNQRLKKKKVRITEI
ncbi:MAG: superfamily II DNA/RNA helicase [Flavobacteriales bacterium]|jgi:superfamily II DNA/RNA helicase